MKQSQTTLKLNKMQKFYEFDWKKKNEEKSFFDRQFYSPAKESTYRQKSLMKHFFFWGFAGVCLMKIGFYANRF